MTPDNLTFEQRFVFAEKDIQSHARTLTAHNEELAAIRIERAENKVRSANLEERLDRIEKSIGGIHKLGWWILTAFGSAFVMLLANFLFKGGFVA